MALRGCDYCDPRFVTAGFLAMVDGRRYCVEHWNQHGRPFPRKEPTAVELANIEAENMRRMYERGGTDRHLVRKGIA